MATIPAALERIPTSITGNDRDFVHLWRILNPFAYVKTASKREFMDRLEWVLRWSTALCFIGHGFWGVVSKPQWVGLITPMGFSESFAWKVLPYIGWADITLGLLVIARPRSVLLWKAFLWACFTPLLRPLAGMSWFEVPERAGNYGIPFAFILMAGGMGLMRTWWNGFEVAEEPESKLSEETIRKIRWVLQGSLGLLLIGHGGLQAIAHKAMFVQHYKAIGIEATPALLNVLGWFEIALGVAVAFRPTVPLVWFIFFWKIATELLFPIAGPPINIFETIERWGDYGGCIALLLVLHYASSRAARPRQSVPAT